MFTKLFHSIYDNKLFLLALSVIMMSMGVIQTAQASDRHIVTIFSDGQKLVVPTKAETVQDVLEASDIEIREDDLVEPLLDTNLDGQSFTINVYRARPITINDDGTLINVVTPHRSPELIAQAAALDLNAADIINFSHSDNFVADKTFGVVMNINRAVKVRLTQYGKSSDVFTHANTVEDFLSEQQIEVDTDDRLVPARATAVKKDIAVQVINVGKRVVTETEVIQHSVRTINDADQETTFREIQTQGVDGQRELSYEVTLHDGEEVGRDVLSDRVITEAVDEVVVIGVKTEELTAVLSASVSVGGTKEQWMSAAGIPESEWWAVDFIVTRESSWNPDAVNPNGGACGLAQQLPCGKWDSYGPWNDPVAALRAQYDYVNGRYGGYSQAVAFWQVNHWY